MADRLLLDAATVARHIDALIASYPELAEDEALRADVLEGETDLHRVVSKALDHLSEAQTFAEALKQREGSLADRRSRFQRREQAMKALIRSLMHSAGQDKLVLPEATISVRAGSRSVEVIDVEALPQGFYNTIRQPDKAALKEALTAGETIPGASLKQGEPSLTIRVS